MLRTKIIAGLLNNSANTQYHIYSCACKIRHQLEKDSKEDNEKKITKNSSPMLQVIPVKLKFVKLTI